MNIKYSIILLLFFWIGISCNGDYLDTYPTNSTDSSTVFETTENAAMAVNGICKLMTRQYLGTQGYNGEGTIKLIYGEYPGNNMYVNYSATSTWGRFIVMNYHEMVAERACYYPWYYYYGLIGNANAIIQYIDDADGFETEKQFIKAQALTFRAYSFFMLSQLYCNRWVDTDNGEAKGIVLRVDTSTGDMPLSTLKETYDQIYADLDRAIELYGKSGLDRDEIYKPNINVAYATYARAALTRQDYAKAATYAPLAREGYPLMSVADYTAGFCNPTSEWIWDSYGSFDETLHYYSYFAYIAYSSSSSAVRSYPKCIVDDLYKRIPETDIRRDLFLNPEEFEYNASNGQVTKNSDLDKLVRKLRPGIQSNANVYAYMQFKVDLNEQYGVGNLVHFRSSEMYLIEAEARYFQQDEHGARKLLEELTRDSGRDPAYACTKNGTALLEEIKTYRGIELWGEGFTWFDMKRWGDTLVRKSYLQGGMFPENLAGIIAPDDKNRWTWKVPQLETDYNEDIN